MEKILMIKILKMLTGEEIIGDVGRNGANWCIVNPMYIDNLQDMEGNFMTKLSLMQPFSNDKEVYFHESHIITSFTVIDVVQLYYTKVLEYAKKSNIEARINNAIKHLEENVEFDVLDADLPQNGSFH
jgi:hypothetical protein